MPKLPRDISGLQLANALARYGYDLTRQSGSHMRLSRRTERGTHHITIPAHSPLKLGTLNGILEEIASNLAMDKLDLMRELFY